MLERFSGFVGCLHRWESTLLWEMGLDFGLSGWREEAYFKHSVFHCLFLFLLLLFAKCQDFVHHTLPSSSQAANLEGRQTSSLSYLQVQSNKLWHCLSALELEIDTREKGRIVFPSEFLRSSSSYPYKYAVWLDSGGLVQLHAFLAGAALIVTDYCCWICPCKTRGGNMSDHFFERIIAIRDGILVQHFGFHL